MAANRWILAIPMIQKMLWYHMTVTWSVQMGVRLYLNGTLAGSTPTVTDSFGNQNPSYDITIGRSSTKASSYGQFYMSEFYFWDRVLKLTEIKTLYF
mgnify:CR=1 FL=1